MELEQIEKPQKNSEHLMAWTSVDQANELQEFIVEKLAIKGNDRVLEVGFGSGALLEKVEKQLTSQAELRGIEQSESMFRQAYERNHLAIEQHRMQLWNTCLWEFKTPEDYYDVIYAHEVHTNWENPVTEFRFLRELLAIGGKLVISFCLQHGQSEDETLAAAYQMVDQYQQAGFDKVNIADQLINGKHYMSAVAYK